MQIALHKRSVYWAGGYLGFITLLLMSAYYADGYFGINRFHPVSTYSRDRAFITDVSYLDLPRMSLTLGSTETGKSGRVTLDLSLEVDKKNAGRLANYQPLINDRLVSYTRAQDVEALRDPINQRMFRVGLLEETKHIPLPVPVMGIVIRRMTIL